MSSVFEIKQVKAFDVYPKVAEKFAHEMSSLVQADKLATDDLGQMNFYREAGYFKETPQPYADLGEIVAGKKAGREGDNERIICINLGLALDDMATAILIYYRARRMGIGTNLEL